MSYKIKTWLFIVSSILIIGIIGFLAFQILLVLFPVILVLYIIFKLKGYIEEKKNKKTQYTYEYKQKYTDERIENMDDSIGEVIDVDYKDVDK